jgi:hypothetical protein
MISFFLCFFSFLIKMSEKALRNLIILMLLISVVLLAIVASKSEHFGGVSGDKGAQAMSARLRGSPSINSLSARLRGGPPITGGNIGAGGLKAQIKIPTLEHFRGVGSGEQGALAARLRQSSASVMGSVAEANSSGQTGHDNTAIKMAIVPPLSKATIMSNLINK